jgi:hypothetical protein
MLSETGISMPVHSSTFVAKGLPINIKYYVTEVYTVSCTATSLTICAVGWFHVCMMFEVHTSSCAETSCRCLLSHGCSTCGFTLDDWIDCFYPFRSEDERHRYYAKRFDSLELNATWHCMMPDRNYICRRDIWQAKGARIAVKVNMFLTHKEA